MNINKEKLERVVETAKNKAAGNARWINAIDKAVEGLLGAWIVTELVEGLLITTESGETYHANGECSCKAYQMNQPCKHRAAAKLVKNYNEVADVATSPLETATDAQRSKIETLTMRISLRGDTYTLRADGKEIIVDENGKLWRVDRKGKVTWDERETTQMVRPQPEGTYYNGWSI